jgi:hypothetical protein
MEDYRISRRVSDRRRGRSVSTWKDGFRDSTQRSNLKDEEYFDRELWKKFYIFRLAKTVFAKFLIILIIKTTTTTTTYMPP